MNAKKAKKQRKAIRRFTQNYYDLAMEIWLANKPPRWRFIAYRKWKKMKPEKPRALLRYEKK